MPDSEKIIVKFPESWKREDLVLDAYGPLSPNLSWIDGGGSRFNMANMHWMLGQLQNVQNVLLLNFSGAVTMYEMSRFMFTDGVKEQIRDAVRDAVRDALRDVNEKA